MIRTYVSAVEGVENAASELMFILFAPVGASISAELF